MDIRYQTWLEKMKDAGRPLVGYECPGCQGEIHSPWPVAGDTYSTMVSCPFCYALHFRVVRADGTVIVDGEVWARKPILRDDHVAVLTLAMVGVAVEETLVATWTDEQYWQAMDWATAEILEASDNLVEVPPQPEFLEQYKEAV